MAGNDDSIEIRIVDNKPLKVEHYTSLSETDDNNSIRLATTSVSKEDCDYLRIISDVLISGDMETAANDSEADVTDNDTHSQCAQKQQYQECNLTARPDKHIYTIVIDDSDVSTQSKPMSHRLS